jgi:hypothetical protein
MRDVYVFFGNFDEIFYAVFLMRLLFLIIIYRVFFCEDILLLYKIL